MYPDKMFPGHDPEHHVQVLKVQSLAMSESPKARCLAMVQEEFAYVYVVPVTGLPQIEPNVWVPICWTIFMYPRRSSRLSLAGERLASLQPALAELEQLAAESKSHL